MCYLVAKNRDAHGCFENDAWKASGRIKEGTESGSWVSGRTAGNDQPAKYAPYHFVDTEQEFRMLVKGLRP